MRFWQLLDNYPVLVVFDENHHCAGHDPLLDLGCSKPNELRLNKPDATGLVVATDIDHAQQITQALEARGEGCRIVTNKTPDAQHVINAFRHSVCFQVTASD